MQNHLLKLKEQVLAAIAEAREGKSLRALEIEYLGRKGRLTAILRGLSDVSEQEKKIVGQLANQIKNDLSAAFRQAEEVFSGQAGKNPSFDVTLPGQAGARGHFHPLTIVLEKLEKFFISLGFLVLDGPELESDYYNFTALNIPPFHPARDMQDTFYVQPIAQQAVGQLVMRTHTSPMQVRAMQKYGAPLRVVVPGRVFRFEATDTRHDTTFYQLEGLMLDRDISLANLTAFMKLMLSAVMGRSLNIRVRPGYFPFVEPGLEVDMSCVLCGGQGCPSCKQTGWLEMIGAGLVHPEVIKAGGLDPEIYSGFAFGIGLDRLAMMKFGINDIRLLRGAHLPFLEQF